MTIANTNKTKSIKCTECTKVIKTEDIPSMITTTHRTKQYHFHQTCFEKLDPNNGNEIRRTLLDYIIELYLQINVTEIPKKIFAQLKTYGKPPYNMSLLDMLNTLKYFIEIKDSTITHEFSLGILPYVYDEAKTFYKKQVEKNDKTMNLDIEEYNLVKTIVLKHTNKTTNVRFALPDIDISALKESDYE